jgi:penicillin V acylase-like amidase (Ntn superfamily)
MDWVDDPGSELWILPQGITTPGGPNVASTNWRTVYDQKQHIVDFDSATSPTVFWVPLETVDFTAGAGVKSCH